MQLWHLSGRVWLLDIHLYVYAPDFSGQQNYVLPDNTYFTCTLY